jgi:hypothetical protein
MRRITRGAALAALLALAGTAPVLAAEGDAVVTTTKHKVSLKERIGIHWEGNTGEIEIWMEPAGTPLKGYPHGSYHTDYEPSGTYRLENPGAGRWELHWDYLGENVVHRSAVFTVKAPPVKRVKGGHYGCYTTTTLGLTRSSIQFVEIRSAKRYRALGDTGRYRYKRGKAKLAFKSGPLRHRVARYEPGREATLIFRRGENERRGKPTIDVSDTYCYRGRD